MHLCCQNSSRLISYVPFRDNDSKPFVNIDIRNKYKFFANPRARGVLFIEICILLLIFNLHFNVFNNSSSISTFLASTAPYVKKIRKKQVKRGIERTPDAKSFQTFSVFQTRFFVETSDTTSALLTPTSSTSQQEQF